MPLDKPEATPPAGGPQRSRRWLIWLTICGAGLFLLLLPVVKFVIPWWRGRRYAARRAEEESAWWHSRWSEAADERNRFFAYQDVLRRLEEVRPALGGKYWWKDRLTRLPEPGDSWPEDDAPIREAVAAWSEILDALEAATEFPDYRLPSTYLEFDCEHSVFREVRVERASFKLFEPHMELSEMLAYRVWIEIREGSRTTGSKRLVVLLRFGKDTARGGATARLMTGCFMLGRVTMVISDTVNLPGWSAADLRALADALQSRLPTLTDLRNAVRTQRLGELLLVARGEPIYVPYRSYLRPFVSYMQAVSVRRYDSFMEELLWALSLPGPAWKVRKESLMRKLPRADQEGLRDYMMLLHANNSRGTRWPFDDALGRALVATAALRMRAVYLEGKGYAKSMDELSEADGRPVIHDHFTGEPLRVLIRDDGSALVHHIGRNEVDEGGRNEHIELLRKHPPRKPEPGTEDAGSVGAYGGYWPDDFGIELRGRPPGASSDDDGEPIDSPGRQPVQSQSKGRRKGGKER